MIFRFKNLPKVWRWLIYTGTAVLLLVALEIVFDFFPEEEKALRRGVREAVEKAFPEQAARIAESFRLTPFESAPGRRPTDGFKTVSAVLIHGLDDPGKVWMNLAPALVDRGFDVWIMSYPNDQPIVDSARLFYRELARVREQISSPVAVVGHSMGGLVSRELLTSPELAYARKAGAGDVPRIAALVMVGTPNNGSEIARLRLFAEVRDQLINMAEGDGHWLRGILDGAGEAKIDLLPNSRFLNTLNARPHPQDIDMFIIAGIASPWDQDEIGQIMDAAGKDNGIINRERVAELDSFLRSVTDGVGDGLVTVASTRIEGVPHQTVRGTHLSMIRNVFKDSQRIPPAVPVIVEHLQSVFN